MRPSISSTARPSTAASSSDSVAATRSTTFSSSASFGVAEIASRTAASAQSALRPCSSATPRAKATVSLVTLRPRAPSTSSPVAVTGVAAPIVVFGAIPATWPAMAMNVPADTASAPGGPTQVMTGTSERSMRPTISFIAPISPPGVSMRSSTARPRLFSAWSMARSM